MSSTNVATITFKIHDEQFSVLLDGNVMPNDEIEFSSSSKRFVEFLTKLNLLESDSLNGSNPNVTIEVISKDDHFLSLKIRKKANFLGLKVLLGEIFNTRREISFNNCKQFA